MHSTALLKLLERYSVSPLLTTEEQPMLERIVEFVSNTPDCFKREHLAGHITASALIVNGSNDAVILMHHKKLDMWVQPGGHADGDSNVLGVAFKEALEETGIEELYPLSQEIFDVDVHWIPEGKAPAHWHYDIRFILQASADAVIVSNDESLEVIWASVSEVMEKTKQKSVLRLIEKWQRESQEA